MIRRFWIIGLAIAGMVMVLSDPQAALTAGDGTVANPYQIDPNLLAASGEVLTLGGDVYLYMAPQTTDVTIAIWGLGTPDPLAPDEHRAEYEANLYAATTADDLASNAVNCGGTNTYYIGSQNTSQVRGRITVPAGYPAYILVDNAALNRVVYGAESYVSADMDTTFGSAGFWGWDLPESPCVLSVPTPTSTPVPTDTATPEPSPTESTTIEPELTSTPVPVAPDPSLGLPDTGTGSNGDVLPVLALIVALTAGGMLAVRPPVRRK